MDADRPRTFQNAQDNQLLAAYIATRSDEAFEQIVQRHLPLVYGVVYRRLGNHHLAEDVAQTVFIILSQKAHLLKKETVLSAWLIRVALLEAKGARRREQRRLAREQKMAAQETSPTAADQSAAQGDLLVLLDEALSRLSARDRRLSCCVIFQASATRMLQRCWGSATTLAVSASIADWSECANFCSGGAWLSRRFC